MNDFELLCDGMMLFRLPKVADGYMPGSADIPLYRLPTILACNQLLYLSIRQSSPYLLLTKNLAWLCHARYQRYCMHDRPHDANLQTICKAEAIIIDYRLIYFSALLAFHFHHSLWVIRCRLTAGCDHENHGLAPGEQCVPEILVDPCVEYSTALRRQWFPLSPEFESLVSTW